MTDVPHASPTIYLASTSPRRRELLNQIGVAHQLLIAPSSPGEDEPQHPGEAPTDYVRRTARDKAERGLAWMRDQALPELPILTADTCVILNGSVLGKPLDRDDAKRILGALSGTCHEVHTALVLMHGGQRFDDVSITQVDFRPLSEMDIALYCDSDEPYGKAGAYGIQGLAATFIRQIRGSYTGVMGLPLYETAQLLERAGIRH